MFYTAAFLFLSGGRLHHAKFLVRHQCVVRCILTNMTQYHQNFPLPQESGATLCCSDVLKTQHACDSSSTCPPPPSLPLSCTSRTWPPGRKMIFGGFCLGVIRQRHHQSWEGELQRVTMGDKIMSGATVTRWGTARVPVMIIWQRTDWLQTCTNPRFVYSKDSYLADAMAISEPHLHITHYMLKVGLGWGQ